MDWDKFHLWTEFLYDNLYKDIIIHRAVVECDKIVLELSKMGISTIKHKKEKKDISPEDWAKYGKLNNILDKINKKYKVKLGLPRDGCDKNQIHKKMDDIIIGKMYNIPAELNGIDTTDKENYFYIPIHKSRRHIHGVPKEFLVNYIMNMIDKAKWEKNYSWYYHDLKLIEKCAVYACPEKYTLVNVDKKNKKIEKEIACNHEINVFQKIKELYKYLTSLEFDKIKKFLHKKRIDNYRNNFPSKSRFITYCAGDCINSFGIIHKGIPSGKQKCLKCKITYCRECGKKPYHENQLCKFENEIQFENPESYRKCPGCTIWVEKEAGCDHMQCACGVHFCYNCRGVLSANDPYHHVCSMGVTDPHFRDFPVNHPTVRYPGELACNCVNCC
jgi:hypothetical protein